MEILEKFYSRVYEKNINKNMLYYSYKVPEDEIKKYVEQVLAVPIDLFVKWDIEKIHDEEIYSGDIFQVSDLQAGTIYICRELNKIDNPGVSFCEAGKLLLNDGKKRNSVAYTKYGENHLKMAEALGLVYEMAHVYFLGCLGYVYPMLTEEQRKRLDIRLFLRNKFIAQIIKKAMKESVDARRFMYMLSDTTYIRRRSSIRSVFKYLQTSNEYDFSEIIERINL